MRSMLKWPDVPAVYGWLNLDRRGNFRIRTCTLAADLESAGKKPVRFEPIGNPALRAFIARNYLADERGCWFFQNGPQRVFVSLAYAPLVFRLESEGLADHCGRPAGMIDAAWLDEEGSLVLEGANGVGLLDDRDLSVFAGELAEGKLGISGACLAVGRLSSHELETRFGFVRQPGGRYRAESVSWQGTTSLDGRFKSSL